MQEFLLADVGFDGVEPDVAVRVGRQDVLAAVSRLAKDDVIAEAIDVRPGCAISTFQIIRY